MSSLRRILASRANGLRSRGPVSPEGKARSARNAHRHGLLSRCVVVADESATAFKKIVDQHIERFQPADGVELAFVEEMSAAFWRMRRAWAIETNTLDQALAAQPEGDPVRRITAAFHDAAQNHDLALIHRYEARLSNMYQRALLNLLVLRDPELPNEPSPIFGQLNPKPTVPIDEEECAA